MGFIFYKNGDYKQAEKFLRIALEKDVPLVLKTIVSSKVYMDILRGLHDPKEMLESHYKYAYQSVYQMLLSIYTHDKNFQEMYNIALKTVGKDKSLFGVHFF